MVLRVFISEEAEAALKAKAAATGVDPAKLAAELIEQQLSRQPRSLEEISGPVAEEFRKSGMTEDELSEFLEQAKHAMRAEKRARQAS